MAISWRKNYTRYREYFLNVSQIYKERPDVKAFLEIFLSLMAISFFSIFALKPTAITIAELTKGIKEKEATLVIMDKKIQDLSRAQTIYSQESSRIALLSQSIPKIPFPELFVRQLEGTAGAQGVKILGISVGEVILKGELEDSIVRRRAEENPLPNDAGDVSFSISVTGDYQNLIGFLGNMESLRRPVKVDLASLNEALKEDEEILVLVISGRIPYFGGEKISELLP